MDSFSYKQILITMKYQLVPVPEDLTKAFNKLPLSTSIYRRVYKVQNWSRLSTKLSSWGFPNGDSRGPTFDTYKELNNLR